MKTIFMTAALLMIGSVGYSRGQENTGGGFCLGADILCDSSDPQAAGGVSLCLFKSKGFALVTVLDQEGHDIAHYYNGIQEIPVNPKLLGAGLTLANADDFDLLIQTDTAPTKEGIYSELNIASLGLKKKELRCKFRRE